MLQMPFSRKGVPYAMSARAYYPNLVAVSVLLLGSVILNSVAQGADVSVQLQAAGSYALPVTLYLFAALIGLIFVRRSGLTLPAAAQAICRAASALVLVTLLVALVPYLLPSPPEGMTLPATLFWAVLGLPVVDLALGFVYALAWAPITGSAEDVNAREAAERLREREAQEQEASLKASSEARARRRAERSRRAEEKRAAKAEKGRGGKAEKGQGKQGKKGSSKH